MALFGLTAVDVTINPNNPNNNAAAASGNGGGGGGSPAAASSSLGPAVASDAATAAHGPATHMPDLLHVPAQGTYLTEIPNSAAAGPGPSMPPTPSQPSAGPAARLAKALAPMVTAPSPPPPPATTSSRALAALATSPTQSASRRLPPIGSNSGAAGTGGGGGNSPERERAIQALSTPQSRLVTPREGGSQTANPVDSRSFDGRDLTELVKVSMEDYSDVPRTQHMITMALGGKTTETAKVEALMQIREASLHNPMFCLTPALVELVKENLLSRNRMLRPAAAYALAGYAANSRHGRGLMAGVNASELLPRLNAMLRCKVDSMDARYGALAVLTASMYPEQKELVGRSGSIPVLIALVRQNIGVVPPNGRLGGNHESTLEHVIGLYESERSSQSSTADGFRPSTADVIILPHNHAHAHAQGQSHAHGSPPRGGQSPHAPHHPHHHPGAPSSSGGGPPHGGYGHGHLGSPHGGGAYHPDHHQQQQHHRGAPPGSGGGGFAVESFPVQAWGSDSGGADGVGTAAGVSVAGMPRAFGLESPQRGSYTLVVKPAAAHAAAALVNLADLPANRQRMREAGIASMLEDVLASRNDNVIKDRCRLLIDFLQMDTQRFKGATASADVATVTAVSHAVINFVQRGRQAKAATAAAAAAAAADHPRNISSVGSRLQGHTGFNVLGGATLKGSLAWNLARQLERGDEEEDRRARTIRERHARAMSRVQSQASTRAGTHGRQTAAPTENGGTGSGGLGTGSGGLGTRGSTGGALAGGMGVSSPGGIGVAA